MQNNELIHDIEFKISLLKIFFNAAEEERMLKIVNQLQEKIRVLVSGETSDESIIITFKK